MGGDTSIYKTRSVEGKNGSKRRVGVVVENTFIVHSSILILFT